MTTPDTPSLDEILQLARQLSPADQARLVAYLAPTLAVALADGTMLGSQTEDPWEHLTRIRDEFRSLGPVSPSVTEELLASRRQE